MPHSRLLGRCDYAKLLKFFLFGAVSCIHLSAAAIQLPTTNVNSGNGNISIAPPLQTPAPSTTGTTQISTSSLNPSAAPATVAGTAMVPTGQNGSNIFNVQAPDGPTYLANVMLATQGFSHNEALAAFAAAALIPVNPHNDFATVCMQKTASGIFRVHSQNPAALGIVTNQTDITAFNELFSLGKKSTFNYNVPTNVDGSGPILTYFGQLFLKSGDGSAYGDVVCFARYR